MPRGFTRGAFGSLPPSALREGAVTRWAVGQKELFIPNAQICLRRTPSLGPSFANFRVPLHFSKLDLRDYLWHAYRIEILNVRSYVKQSPVQSGVPWHTKPAARRWHRPKSKKYMTVELVRPFVWPEEPEDFGEWNKEETEMAEKEQSGFQDEMGGTADTLINKERRERMREQARSLLEGKSRWKPSTGGEIGVLRGRESE